MLTWINSSGHVMRKEIDSQGAAGEALNQRWLWGILLNNGGNFTNNQFQVSQSCSLTSRGQREGPGFAQVVFPGH